MTVSGPCTIAQEWRVEEAFRQSTATRQPRGIRTRSFPRPYPSKLNPLFASEYPAISVNEAVRLAVFQLSQVLRGGDAANATAPSASAVVAAVRTEAVRPTR